MKIFLPFPGPAKTHDERPVRLAEGVVRDTACASERQHYQWLGVAHLMIKPSHVVPLNVLTGRPEVQVLAIAQKRATCVPQVSSSNPVFDKRSMGFNGGADGSDCLGHVEPRGSCYCVLCTLAMSQLGQSQTAL